MFKYCSKVQHPILFVEMRLGKTLVAVRKCKTYAAEHILIACPYSAFKSWRDELVSEGQGKLIELTGKREARLKLLKKAWGKHKWFIASKECHQVIPELAHLKWDVIIIDESTFIKNVNKTSTFYINNFRKVTHRWLLTGTPAPESELNYFLQLQFADKTILGLKDYWHFRQKYFEPVDYSFEISGKGYKFLSQRLAQKCFFLTRKQAGIGNIKVYEQRMIKMPPTIKKTYKVLKNEFIYETKNNFKFTKFATTKFIWLRKLCGGVMDTELLWKGKTNELFELNEGELKNEQIVIWCAYRDDIWAIANHFTGQVPMGIIHGDIPLKKREELLQQFNEGKLRWLVAIPECLKYGVDLSAASTCIFYSTPLGSETRMQAEDRIVSVAKKEPVLIIDLIVEDTIEETIYDGLAKKEGKQLIMKRVVRQLTKDLND